MIKIVIIIKYLNYLKILNVYEFLINKNLNYYKKNAYLFC